MHCLKKNKKTLYTDSLYLFVALSLSPLTTLAGGSFSQTDWRGGIPLNAAKCSIAGGSWSGTECLASHPVDQLRWDVYSSQSTEIIASNEGSDIDSSTIINSVTHTLDNDFAINSDTSREHTSDSDFTNGATLNSTRITGNSVILGAGSGIGWIKKTDWDFDPNIPGIRAAPALGDLDGDGDLDMMVGDYNGDLYALENDGSNTWVDAPWDITTSYSSAIPTLGDLDGDGDLDLFVGFKIGYSGILYAYRNDDIDINVGGSDATIGVPVWTRNSSWDWTGYTYGWTNWTPDLVDLDGDTDLDLLSCYSNRCRARLNNDVEDNTIRDGFAWGGYVTNWFPPSISYYTPFTGDFDGDGDPDMMIGTAGGTVLGYENIGGTGNIWSANSTWDTPDMGSYIQPVLIDMDNDGDLDMLAGENTGTILGYENASYASTGTYTSTIVDAGVHAGFSTLDFTTTIPAGTTITISARSGNHATDTNDSSWGSWITISNSGDPISALGLKRYIQYEAVLTTTVGSLTPSLDDLTINFLHYPMLTNITLHNDLVELTYTDKNPVWNANANWDFNPAIGTLATPTFGDLDGDGNQDMLIGDNGGDIYAFRNEGNGSWSDAAWDIPTSYTSAAPMLGDLDGDGDLDLFVGYKLGYYGQLYAYRNDDLDINVGGSDSTLGTPIWTRHTAWDFSAYTYGWSNWRSDLVDIDGDSDLDVVWCYSPNNCRARQNNDIEGNGVLDGFIWGGYITNWYPPSTFYGAPAIGDLNGDGLPDMMLGQQEGIIYGYKNIGGTGAIWSATPDWDTTDIDLISAPTPDSTDYPRPALIDIDGDSDLDMLVGDEEGFILAYRNDEVITYEATGSYTSAVIEINGGIHAGLASINYTTNTPGLASILLDVRAGNTLIPDDGSWSGWLSNLTDGDDISSLGSARYVQYRSTHSSSAPSDNPAALLDVTVNYNVYPGNPSLISSPFDSGDNANTLASLSWTMGSSAADDLLVRIRTAPDNGGTPGTWTDFVGPDGSNASYWSRNNVFNGGCSGTTTIACSTLPTMLSDASNDRWIQYQVTLSSAGDVAPTLADISIAYESLNPAITVTPISGLETTESAGQASFSVKLDAPPSSNVNISLWSSDTSEGTIDKSSLTFTNGNWDIPQIVTITGADDGVTDGFVSYTIYTNPATGDAAYSGINANDVAVSNRDNEAGVAAISYSGTSLITSEASGVRNSVSFYLSLLKQPLPSTTVTLNLNNGDTSEGSLSVSALNFDDSNWSIPQRVIVTAVDDFLLDGDIGYTITIPTISGSGDPAYDGYNPADITVVNLDDDVAGITLNYSGNLNTTESGGSDSFTIVLDNEPSADVTINIFTDDLTEGLPLSFNTLFTSSNWNTHQTVIVRGLDDSEIDGSTAYNITFPTVTSADSNYAGYLLSSIPVINSDNDGASVSVDPISGLSTTAQGGQALFSVVLDYAPTTLVTIPISSDNPNEGTVSSSQLVFNASNWNTPQYVTVTGNNNSPGNDPISYNIVLGAAISSGPYSGVDPSDVAITNNLDDPGFLITPSGGLIASEGGSAITIDISLKTPPASQITLYTGRTNTADVSAPTPSVLYFNSTTWATPQTVTISAANDAAIDGPISSYITLLAQYGSADYFGMKKNIPIVTADNDSASIAISRNELFTSESGASTPLTVALGQAPSADVDIIFTSNDPGEGAPSTDPTTLTFTPANYNTPQTVTIVGADDGLADGDVSYTIAVTTSSSDIAYNSLAVTPVEIINIDNEAGITVTPRTTVQTSETGAFEMVAISLNQQPNSEVSFNLNTDNSAEGSIIPFSMSFTPVNWNIPQYATLFGVNDGVIDSDVAYNYIASNFSSNDSNYNNIGSFSFPAINTESTSYEVNLLAPSGTIYISEADGTETRITIRLGSRPSADITIPLSVTDTTEAYVPASITIPAVGYGWQNTSFNVTALDDIELDSDQPFQLIISPFVSADTNFNGVDLADLNFVNRDDELYAQAMLGAVSNRRLGTALSAGDFNGDGHIDLAGAGQVSSPLVYHGDGSGKFSSTPDSIITDSSFSTRGFGDIVSGDFNADGYDDLVISTKGAYNLRGYLAVYQGSASGVGNRHLYVMGSGTNVLGHSVATGRLNNDIYDDLIVGAAGAATGRVAVFYGSATGLVTSALYETNADWYIDGAVGEKIGVVVDAMDMDGDGYDDIIASSSATNNSFIFYSNNDGSGMAVTPQQTIIDQGSTPIDMDVGDVNGDGFPDLFVSNDIAGPGSVGQVYGYYGPFVKGSTITAYNWVIQGTKYYGRFGSSFSLLEDANGDGYPDMAVGAWNGNTPNGDAWGKVDLYLGSASGLNTSPFISSYPDSIAYLGFEVDDIGDTDGDGNTNYASGAYVQAPFGAIYTYALKPAAVPALTLTPSSGLTTTESGGTDSFVIGLATPPTTDVTVTLSSSSSEGNVSPSSMTFTLLDWRGTTFTVTGQDDAAQDGPVGYSINITTSSSDTNYNGLTASVSVTNADDDTPGIIVTPTSGLTTAETSATANFSLVLTSRPNADVVINLSSSLPGEGLPTTNTLTFTSNNWSTAQSVSIVGQDDQLADGDIAYTIITSASSADANYNGIAVDDVSLINLDNDALPNITVTAIASEAAEGSGSGTFSITRSGSTAAALNIFYSLGGSATEGSDYPAATGNISIPIGQSSASFNITPSNDTQRENNETVVITLLDNAFYMVNNPASATITILDNLSIQVPSLNFSSDQVAIEGGVTSVQIYLSGTPDEYPVTIPFTVGGTATQLLDHTAQNGNIVIASGLSGEYSLGIINDGIDDPGETIVLTMGTPETSATLSPSVIAKIGDKSTHTITIVETANVAPAIELTSVQNTKASRLIIAGDGAVFITATVDDPNTTNTHSYDWSASNNALVDVVNSNPADFVFDPAALANGFYNVVLTVTDNGTPPLSSTVELLLEIASVAPTLSAVDSDGDGISDDVESYDDSDNDGIPDYLDNSNLASNELQILGADSENYVMSTEAGLNLRLGDVAFAAGTNSALITAEDIALYGDGEGGAPSASANDNIPNTGGYFDFEVTGLPNAGQSINIVIPRLAPLPFNSVYRKYDATLGWRDYVVDNRNAIYSALGSPGECPDPGNIQYTAGLSSGDYCVQLLIEDGGPNDTDGIANHVIEDPAQIVQIQSPVFSGRSGGGAVSVYGLLFAYLILFAAIRRKRIMTKP